MAPARRHSSTTPITSAKTGTSTAYRDAWFVGFTGQYVAGVWLGNDDFTPMARVTGGSFPAQTWHNYHGAAPTTPTTFRKSSAFRCTRCRSPSRSAWRSCKLRRRPTPRSSRLPRRRASRTCRSMTRQVLEKLGTMLKEARPLQPSDTRPQNRPRRPRPSPPIRAEHRAWRRPAPGASPAEGASQPATPGPVATGSQTGTPSPISQWRVSFHLEGARLLDRFTAGPSGSARCLQVGFRRAAAHSSMRIASSAHRRLRRRSRARHQLGALHDRGGFVSHHTAGWALGELVERGATQTPIPTPKRISPGAAGSLSPRRRHAISPRAPTAQGYQLTSDCEYPDRGLGTQRALVVACRL